MGKKTSLDSQSVQQLNKLFVESLQGRGTQVQFGEIQLGNGEATLGVPKGIKDYEVFLQQIGTTVSRFTYSYEKAGNKFIIHSSDGSDTSKMSVLLIGK